MYSDSSQKIRLVDPSTHPLPHNEEVVQCICIHPSKKIRLFCTSTNPLPLNEEGVQCMCIHPSKKIRLFYTFTHPFPLNEGGVKKAGQYGICKSTYPKNQTNMFINPSIASQWSMW